MFYLLPVIKNTVFFYKQKRQKIINGSFLIGVFIKPAGGSIILIQRLKKIRQLFTGNKNSSQATDCLLISRRAVAGVWSSKRTALNRKNYTNRTDRHKR
ncbi:hypothetical protein [Caldanaerobacter subterraneus]|uniref:hypothetical protein n=1 Tax=Caldanaerobacter subterraneus TaxID=911092 RepID=UPI00104D0172|nr:hypothetical protein [Caldanaerobacter subterraneus]